MRAAELNYQAWSDESTYVLHATVNKIYDSREQGNVCKYYNSKALTAAQPDQSESASESSTSGKFSGQWRTSGGPIGTENLAGAPDTSPNPPGSG